MAIFAEKGARPKWRPRQPKQPRIPTAALPHPERPTPTIFAMLEPHPTPPIPAAGPAPRQALAYAGNVAAGFPSPAEDYPGQRLDLHQLLVKHPHSTFFLRARGQSMLGAGIHDGDLLVVDRSLEARDGSVAVVLLDGEFTLKRLRRQAGRVWLQAENPDFPDIHPGPESQMELWGVVSHVIHALR